MILEGVFQVIYTFSFGFFEKNELLCARTNYIYYLCTRKANRYSISTNYSLIKFNK